METRNFKTAPEIKVYSPDRRLMLGAVANPISLTEDVRFNAASEIQFSVAEKYYDSNTYKWVKNPIYDKLVEDNLLYVQDDRSYFSFPKSSCHPEHITYELKTNSLGTRAKVDSTYAPNCNNFTIQPETELFDIGSNQGYYYQSRAYLGTATGNNKGVFCHSAQNSRLYRLLACDTFIPINKGDVVYLNSGKDTKNPDDPKKWFLSYHICYYAGEDSANCTHEYPASGFINGYIPCPETKSGTVNNEFYTIERGKIYSYYQESKNYRISEFGAVASNRNEEGYVYPAYERLFPDIRIPIKDQLGGANSGYMRVSVYVAGDMAYTTESANEDGGTTTYYHWHYPSLGYVKVYSGERRCSHINTRDLGGRFEPKIQWFTISGVDEVDNGVCKVKTVKAYTYEYTLSKRTFSISESTIPLYVPPAIQKLVSSKNWVVDNTGSEIKTCAQTMKTGLLNQILKHLPSWKLGYISSALLTRFRTIGETDNANIYSFLMNDVQSLYQCYFVFDSNNKTISAYTKEDIGFNLRSNIHFTWDNVIKELNVTNSDTNYTTALRVHTAEDTYSLGLINPTGNDIIYDFAYPKENGWFDFVADSEKNRTLKDAVEYWQEEYNKHLVKTDNVKEDSDVQTYRDAGIRLISAILEETKASSSLALALADYRAKADEINVLIENDYKDNENEVPLSYIIGDKPRTTDEMTEGTFKPKSKYQNYHSRSLYNELFSLAKNYEEKKIILEQARASIATNKSKMQEISSQLSLSCNDENKIQTPILSLAERQALDYYIKESNWTHENMVFSETYSKDDIYNTLNDVYNDAKSDLNNRLNKPTFEFSFDISNPFVISEMKQQLSSLKLGRSCNLEVSQDRWVSPILLEIHIDYSDDTNTTFTFSTDYKRKPLQNRFADLFGTINQVSVKESVFTFTE